MLCVAVLVRKGPDGKAQLVLLDHGLYEFLSEGYGRGEGGCLRFCCLPGRAAQGRRSREGPGAVGTDMGSLTGRDRAALCQLWQAIILRNDAAMKVHSAALGVKGEWGWASLLRGCSRLGAGPCWLPLPCLALLFPGPQGDLGSLVVAPAAPGSGGGSGKPPSSTPSPGR